MRFFVWLISGINVYFGFHYFLNMIGVLQNSKYSATSTAVFAILFLSMGLAGFYFSLLRHNQKMALLIGIGPWVLALIFLLINMLTADYK